MIEDIRIALSSRSVVVILTISALIRIVFHFLLLPNSPSTFGPDEGTYSALAKYVSQGLPAQEFPVYGPGLYNSSKSLMLPSALLVKLGIGELNALRIISSGYGLASTLFMVLCYLAYLRFYKRNTKELSSHLKGKLLALVAVFAFFPSTFVWSTVGLRESGSQFWLLTTFYFLLRLLTSRGIDQLKFTSFASIALTLSYGMRPEAALVFSVVATIISIGILLRFRKILPLVAILVGIFCGQIFTTTPEAGPSKNTATISSTVSKSVQALQDQILVLDVLESRRNANSLEAKSALPTSTCQNLSGDVLSIIRCNFSELPYRLFAFLFRPLLFFDHGSASLNFAALENLVWMALIPLSFWVAVKREQGHLNRLIILSLSSYVLIFSSAAALYEGNLGTAFRHKSTILWPLIFILIISREIFPRCTKFKKVS